MIRSRIIMSEAVENTARRFGASDRYYPVYVRRGGEWVPALFTYHELTVAVERATVNPEDIPPRSHLWRRVLGWFVGKL
jgi:hypothetical protein